MAKALKIFTSAWQNVGKKILNRNSGDLVKNCMSNELAAFGTSRTLRTLPSTKSLLDSNKFFTCSKINSSFFSTEVDKEISKFLDKEIDFENKRLTKTLPKVPGFEIQTNGADVTLTKVSGKEKVIVRLSVNGAAESSVSEQSPDNEPPQIICKPTFDVEIIKGDGKVLSIQCIFPTYDDYQEPVENQGQQPTEQLDDQFEISEVAIHDGEWKDSTFVFSANLMDPELFDLLMDMLDERGINDEFISHLVEFCTVYENQLYMNFLQDLKVLADK